MQCFGKSAECDKRESCEYGISCRVYYETNLKEKRESAKAFHSELPLIDVHPAYYDYDDEEELSEFERGRLCGAREVLIKLTLLSNSCWRRFVALSMYATGATCREIGEALGVSRQGAHKHVIKGLRSVTFYNMSKKRHRY